MTNKGYHESTKRTSEGLRERWRRRYGAHPILGERERVTLEGQRRAVVYGCLGIIVYSPSEIRLRLSGDELSVIGERLYCSSFSAGTVTVEGQVGGILYRACRIQAEQEGRGRI